MSAEAHLSFHGATREVTGSCFLFEACGKKVLIDCGLYQGGSRLPEANELPFAFNPAEIDCLLLTHAHLDHCGRIPLLVTRGFTGENITTNATRELARIVLLDSAHLQQEEAERAVRQHGRTGNGSQQPLYNLTDVLRTFDYFGREAKFDAPLSVADGLDVTFHQRWPYSGGGLDCRGFRRCRRPSPAHRVFRRYRPAARGIPA